MKLHKDGTVEGTPEEIVKYKSLTPQPYPLELMGSNLKPKTLAEQCAIESVYAQIKEISTKELANELSRRAGVRTISIDPHTPFRVQTDKLGLNLTGPAKVLINQD